MKKVLIILGAVFAVALLLLAGLITLVFKATSGLPETAERFFSAVRSNDLAAAEAELSEEFKASTDRAALRRFLGDSALTDVVEGDWSSRNFTGSRGELSGAVVTSGGGRIPLTIKFVEENDAWKIYSISKPEAGLSSSESGQLAMPDLAARTALVKRSMHDFALALERDSMAPFYDSISALWRKQTTVEELDGIFADFYTQDISLLVLDALQPQFDADPRIDEDGVLILEGHYATEPSVVHFSHRYILEGTDWRLIGIDVQVK